MISVPARHVAEDRIAQAVHDMAATRIESGGLGFVDPILIRLRAPTSPPIRESRAKRKNNSQHSVTDSSETPVLHRPRAAFRAVLCIAQDRWDCWISVLLRSLFGSRGLDYTETARYVRGLKARACSCDQTPGMLVPQFGHFPSVMRLNLTRKPRRRINSC